MGPGPSFKYIIMLNQIFNLPTPSSLFLATTFYSIGTSLLCHSCWQGTYTLLRRTFALDNSSLLKKLKLRKERKTFWGRDRSQIQIWNSFLKGVFPFWTISGAFSFEVSKKWEEVFIISIIIQQGYQKSRSCANIKTSPDFFII